eukprot:7156139-Prymnesium_polylepis.1
MEVQGPGADEWRHHDIISLSVPQALGTAGCGDGGERCRLVPAAAAEVESSSDSEEEALAQVEQRAAAGRRRRDD